MADDSTDGTQKGLTCSACGEALPDDGDNPELVAAHYAMNHPSKSPAHDERYADDMRESMRRAGERNLERARCSICEQGAAPYAAHVTADHVAERFEDRACKVKGCTRRHALLYGVCIEGEPLAVQLGLCGEHGAVFLLRSGQVLGELLKGT